MIIGPAGFMHAPRSEPRRITDPCEWNPDAGRFAFDHEVHGQAEVILGAKGQLRVCHRCAALPALARYRVRRPIERRREW